MTEQQSVELIDGYVMHRPLPLPLGGTLILIDTKDGGDWIDADDRWVLFHEPTTVHVSVATKKDAIGFLRDAAKGVDNTGLLHDIAEHISNFPEELKSG